MCANGAVLRNLDHVGSDLQTEAQRVIDAGTMPLSSEELDQRRYGLTDTLDDLRGTTDPIEMAFIAGHLLASAGELVLLNRRRWTGQSKWLARHLAEAPGGFAGLLANGVYELQATGDKQPMINAVGAVLDLAGGPLTEGYRAPGPVEGLFEATGRCTSTRRESQSRESGVSNRTHAVRTDCESKERDESSV